MLTDIAKNQKGTKCSPRDISTPFPRICSYHHLRQEEQQDGRLVSISWGDPVEFQESTWQKGKRSQQGRGRRRDPADVAWDRQPEWQRLPKARHRCPQSPQKEPVLLVLVSSDSSWISGPQKHKKVIEFTYIKTPSVQVLLNLGCPSQLPTVSLQWFFVVEY